jgi:hypothetical protein
MTVVCEVEVAKRRRTKHSPRTGHGKDKLVPEAVHRSFASPFSCPRDCERATSASAHPCSLFIPSPSTFCVTLLILPAYPYSSSHRLLSMSCQYSNWTMLQALLATWATLPVLFAQQAWAAPHSSLVRRDTNSGGSKIAVRHSMIHILRGSPLNEPLTYFRLPSSPPSFSSLPFRWCFIGRRSYRGSGTSLSTPCRCDGARQRRPSGTLPPRRSQGQPRRTRLKLQPLAQSDGRGAPGALPVKSRRARFPYT